MGLSGTAAPASLAACPAAAMPSRLRPCTWAIGQGRPPHRTACGNPAAPSIAVTPCSMPICLQPAVQGCDLDGAVGRGGAVRDAQRRNGDTGSAADEAFRLRHTPHVAGHSETRASTSGRHGLRALPRRMVAKVEPRDCILRRTSMHLARRRAPQEATPLPAASAPGGSWPLARCGTRYSPAAMRQASSSARRN